MHTAVTDLNPNFASGLLMTFLSEEDILRNGYDQALGPCCNKKKWVEGGDTQVFIPIEDLEGYVDVTLLSLFGDEEGEKDECWDEPTTTNNGSHRTVDITEITQWLHVRYAAYMEEETDDDIQDFNQFSGVIGTHKHAQVCHPKVCTLRRACRFEESHGKRGREKRFSWSVLARESEGWRERVFQFLETY